MNDSPPKEPTFEEMVEAAKAKIGAAPAEDKRDIVIRAQGRTIQAQAETIAHLMEQLEMAQGAIAMLCGECE